MRDRSRRRGWGGGQGTQGGRLGGGRKRRSEGAEGGVVGGIWDDRSKGKEGRTHNIREGREGVRAGGGGELE